MKKSLLSLLAALLLFVGATSTFSVKASSDVIFGDLGSTSSSSKTWTYDGYTVRRYDIGYEGSNYPVQLEGTDVLREKGIFLFSNLKDYRLFYMWDGQDQVTETSFALPTERTCFGCATSLSTFVYPVAHLIDERVVVMHGNDIYLYDVEDSSAELWFDAEEVGLDAYDWEPFTYNGQLYVASYLEQRDNGSGVYWVPKPNAVERHSETPGDLSYSVNGMSPSYTEYEYDTPTYLKGTSAFGNGDIVGQINHGVYLYQQQGSELVLSRIGYTAHSVGASYAGILSFTPSVALTFGNQSIAWIGSDHALYVATITGYVKETGVQDIPAYTPFRTESVSTVYYDPANPGGYYVFMNADAYINYFDDPTFSKVVTIPDSAVAPDEFTQLHDATYFY